MNSIPKFCGYYIDSDSNHYNTFGQINGEWKDGVRYYININKKVTLEGNYLAEAMSGTNGDKLYEPIGSRIKNNLFNMVLFSSFSIVKSSSTSSNQYSILLSGGIKIDLNPKEDDIESNVFFSNYSDIKNELNQNNTISVGSIFGETTYFEFPGLNSESFRLLDENPIMFIQNYCKDTNQDYLNFKQYIIKMHSIFNILSWCFEGKLLATPGILLIISNAYYSINIERSISGEPKLEYFLTIPCDLDGINSTFINSWEKNYIQIFNDNIYQKPLSLGFFTCSFNPTLFQQSYDGNNIIESIINAPFNNVNNIYSGKSIDIVKSLLGSTDLPNLKSRSFIIPWINHYEPSNSVLKKEIAKFIDEQFIKELTSMVLLKGLNGVVLYKDRGFDHENFNLINPLIKVSPATINYDNSISQINSKLNQDITKSFINRLNNNKQ